jgi:hypothetical protein
LRIINVANPASPTDLGVCPLPGFSYAVAVSGDTAFVANSMDGLRVVSLSPPNSPTEIGYYNTPGTAADVAVAGGLIYLADEVSFGVYSYAVPSAIQDFPTRGLPQNITLQAAYPNPFNASTTLSFTLTNAMAVELNLYDITGRLLKTLAARFYSAGNHALQFDGSGFSSGTYIVAMKSGPAKLSQKIVLLK